ncbi:MAG TPA: hypothetical protein VMW49_02750, partial [Candidatus Dormibacteraeota bacterium]|nr:hypothetical protein [Candidatus Dormibacteraeota bacterium]
MAMAIVALLALSALRAPSASAATTWTATTAPLGGLSPAANPLVSFGYAVSGMATEPVSCPASGTCVAVGHYIDSAGHQQGLIESLAGGTWTAAVAPLAGLSPAAATDPAVWFYALSCPVAGWCVATGSYFDVNGDQQGLIETLSSGTWTAQTAPLTGLSDAAGYNPTMDLQDVSCPATGSCVAVGFYDTSSPAGLAAVIETLSAGTWTATTAPGTGSQLAAGSLYGVSCPATGWCVAVGQIWTSTGGSSAVTEYTALIETLSGGGWAEQTAPMSGL